MKLYHGSSQIVERPKIINPNRALDFGGKAAMHIFSTHGIIGYIWASYEALHTMADDIVIQDIDTIVTSRKNLTIYSQQRFQ